MNTPIPSEQEAELAQQQHAELEDRIEDAVATAVEENPGIPVDSVWWEVAQNIASDYPKDIENEFRRRNGMPVKKA